MLLTPKGYTQTAEGQAGSLANILGGAITGYKIGGSLGRCQPHMDNHFKDKLFFT